ncbi:MAG: cbb3-type cytochrome c oxidase subunit II, partial [Verrucomicrobiota bacterium]|nr:cbb3-type cytochrome c oxidase subunit II [Verrucomicrobiota bacterium]
MKGILPLFLGIFGTFAFSWAGLILIPNAQIGHLDPQMDEDGNDAYPAPKSGMADRGRKVYAANGCVYCHSQQVRADYAASDIDRKWGDRRSAPRDYIFERPALLGKMRMGPDLSNVGKRAPVEDQNAPPPSTTNASSPAAPQTSPVAPAAPGTSPATSPAAPAASPSAKATTSPAVVAAPSVSPAASPAKKETAATTPASPAPATSPATAAASPASSPISAATTADTVVSANGAPLPYSAAWHHRHLYDPRSITHDTNMPAYHFLY